MSGGWDKPFSFVPVQKKHTVYDTNMSYGVSYESASVYRCKIWALFSKKNHLTRLPKMRKTSGDIIPWDMEIENTSHDYVKPEPNFDTALAEPFLIRNTWSKITQPIRNPKSPKFPEPISLSLLFHCPWSCINASFTQLVCFLSSVLKALSLSE